MRRAAILAIALAALLLAAASCGPCRCLPVETNVKDSTAVHYVDSTIVTVRDSVVLVPLPAEESSAVLPEGFHSHVQTSLAESDAWVEDGLLHHTIRNRSDQQLPVIVPITTTATVQHASSDHAQLAQHTVIREVERKLNWWQRFRLGAFFWLLALAVVGWRREIWSLLKHFIKIA
jgi:hypothetical protein